MVSPREIPGLVAFWDFQPAGIGDLTSCGRQAYTFEEMNGPVERLPEGVFGASSLRFHHGQWLRIPRAACPALNFHGKQELSMIAWVRREDDNHWQYIAGMWDERGAMRQYALFVEGYWQADHATLDRIRAEHQVHGYISNVGGATPGKPYCFSYATGATKLNRNRWYQIAYTFDRETLRVYVDGKLDRNGNYNPFHWNQPIFHPVESGPDFTVAQRDHPHWPDYPSGRIQSAEGFTGSLGGLAVFGRALSAPEIASLACVGQP